MSVTKPCKTCGQPFEAIAAQAYCHNPCQAPSRPDLKPLGPLSCPGCSKTFMPRSRAQRRCDECNKAWAPHEAVCATLNCGNLYQRTAPAQRYCPDCKAAKGKLAPRRCVRCDREYEPTFGNQKYCKPECRDAGNAPRHQIHPDYEYAKVATWGKYVRKLAGDTCADCGTTESLEAHHIVPKSRGGKNTMRNGVLLCNACHNARHLPIDGDLVDRIAQRVSELLSADLEVLGTRLAALEELANRY